MKKAKDFEDQWGLLDKHYLPDGGDSCQREGMYWSLVAMGGFDSQDHDTIAGRWNNFEIVMKKIHPHPGVLLRHSNTNWDASDWDRMSRDQLQPIIIACGYWSKNELRKLAKGHLKRGFLFANNTRQNGATKHSHGQPGYSYAWKFPDPTGPEIWGNFIRAFRAWYLYPLLWIFDLELLFGSVKWRYWPKHNITLNHTISVMQATDRMPTLWSWLATKIMPVERLIDLAHQHFKDFPDDMEFMAEMMRVAWRKIKG